MRNPNLHGALHAFAEEAAGALRAETAAGAEIPFELVEAGVRPRGGVPLYCYRPLTGRFLSERSSRLRALVSYAPALRAVEGQAGVESYLAERGCLVPASRERERERDRARAVLAVFLERLFEGRSEFSLEQQRFACAYAELERCLYDGSSRTVVLAPLVGLQLDAGALELALGEGLSLKRGDEVADAPSEAVWGDGEEPSVLIVLSVEDDPEQPAPIAVAHRRFWRFLTALRLYEKGDFGLGPIAWARRNDGAWRAVSLGGNAGSGSGRGSTLAPEQEDELRAFCNLVARRAPRTGEVLWALNRYEMGRERERATDALSDYLLALRALFEPEGPSSGRLAHRLATICAVPAQRAALAGRVVRAVELERAVIAGHAREDGAAEELIEEMGEHLRAILRDVVCGHLDEDLVGVADELLAASAAPQGAIEEPATLS